MNLFRRWWTPPAGPKPTRPMTTAVLDVLGERDRQVSDEGYDAAHDDLHTAGELSLAGAAYAAAAAHCMGQHHMLPSIITRLWPFQGYELKLRKPARQLLVQAAAFLIAEIERIDRAAGRG